MAVEEIRNGKLNEPKEESVEQEEVIHARSAEVQDIIGRPPHWLVRGGITGFLGVLILIFAVAAVIKYPKVIRAPLRLVAVNEPKVITSKVNGKLVKLFYNNGSHVKQSQILAWMESTARHSTVLGLSAKVDSMKLWLRNRNPGKIQTLHTENYSELGELQANFQTFEEALRTFITYLPGGFYSKKRKILKREINYKRQLFEKLKDKKKLQQIKLNTVKEEYKAQKILAKKNLIAPLDFAKIKSKMASSRLPVQQTESAIISNRASQAAQKQKLLELNKEIAEQKAIFRQALNALKSSIDSWKSKYLVVSPMEGMLVYAGIIQQNQTLKTGQRMAYIKPDSTHFFGEMIISQRSFGEITEGQNVLVKFSGYPAQEYGSVKGRVSYLSAFPVQDSVFLAKVKFPGGLKTNYGKKLPPTSGMTGHAKIITKDMRFIERIYNNLTKQLR